MHPTKPVSRAKVSIGLFVRGENLDPDNVTARLGAAPTIRQTKGQARVAPDGRQIEAKGGLWARVIDADDVADVDKLLATVASGAVGLGSIADVAEAYFDLFVACESEKGRTDLAFRIDTSTMTAVAAAGLPLRMTFASMPR